MWSRHSSSNVCLPVGRFPLRKPWQLARSDTKRWRERRRHRVLSLGSRRSKEGVPFIASSAQCLLLSLLLALARLHLSCVPVIAVIPEGNSGAKVQNS